jgi:beta-glucanase (GH16 family)
MLRIAVPALLILWIAADLAPALQDYPREAEWRLVWADEFAIDGPPDPRNWTFEQGFVRNEELQWYQPQNAAVRDGHLVIEARRERVANPRHVKEGRRWSERRPYAEYTSASLMTRGLQAWQYGRFEMRGRIDTRPGLWPAFWTLGVDGEWPDGGEIDIMEYYRGVLLANVAWGSAKRWVATWDAVRTQVADFGPGWTDAFHVWRMDWDEREIRLSVDDRVLNVTSLSDTVNTRTTAHPFRQPHYLLLSLAIGGTNGGDPSATAFPARLEVDYVRVYERTPAVVHTPR